MQSQARAFVIVTPGFPANEEDSSCLPPVQQFALSLNRQLSGIKLIVVTLQYPFADTSYLWNGIEVISIGGKNRRHLWNRITRLRALTVLEKLQSGYNLQGVLSFWCTDAALIANRFSAKNNLLHRIWIHGQDARKENKLVSKINPSPEQLIALSNFLKHEFSKNHGIEPMHVIENGISESLFPALNTNKRSIDILGVGSLIPLKNYALFIELVAEAKKSHPDLRVLIAGEGPEYAGLESQIKSLALENTVSLCGKKTHAEILKLMNDSRVFLHTSSYEGNSTVLIESLYSGCSVLSTCALSDRPVENLIVAEGKEELKSKLLDLLGRTEHDRKRILFNSMDVSAKKILALFAI